MQTLSPSATVTINSLAQKKRKNGEKVYNFAAGDPVLVNHPAIIQAAMKQTEQGHCPYPPLEGVPELRKLAAEWMNRSCSTNYAAENVLVTCGGKFALYAAVHSLLQPNEEVLIPAPYWVSYPDIVRLAGGIPRIIETKVEHGWKISSEDLLSHATKQTKMLILNNACNPTGVVYTSEEIREILKIAKQLGLTVISDEVYSGMVYDGSFTSCGSFPEYQDNVIVVQSCSKNFGMAGWRVGFAMGPEKVIKRLSLLQSHSTTGTSLISQWAAVGALENADAVNAYVKKAMKDRRDLFVNTFNALFPKKIPNISSAIYAWVPLTSLSLIYSKNSKDVCEQLITSANIALVPGVAFGAEGHVRFAFSETIEDIRQGLQSLYNATLVMSRINHE